MKAEAFTYVIIRTLLGRKRLFCVSLTELLRLPPWPLTPEWGSGVRWWMLQSVVPFPDTLTYSFVVYLWMSNQINILCFTHSLEILFILTLNTTDVYIFSSQSKFGTVTSAVTKVNTDRCWEVKIFFFLFFNACDNFYEPKKEKWNFYLFFQILKKKSWNCYPDMYWYVFFE